MLAEIENYPHLVTIVSYQYANAIVMDNLTGKIFSVNHLKVNAIE